METLQKNVADAAWQLLSQKTNRIIWKGLASAHRSPGSFLQHLTAMDLMHLTPTERLLLPIFLWKEYGGTMLSNEAEQDLMIAVGTCIDWQLSWYDERDLDQEGLPCLFSAKESIMPNAPYWSLMQRIDHCCEVQEPAHLAVLVWSNECLLHLSGRLGLDAKELVEQNELTVFSMNDLLWDTEYGIFLPRDRTTGHLHLTGSIGGVIPLIAEIGDQEQAEAMRIILEANFIEDDHYWFPTVSLFNEDCQVDTPDSGAVDPLINWLLYYGLMRYDFDDLSIRLRENLLHLIGEYGFYPYYEHKISLLGNRGLGKGQNCNSAAVFIDIMKSQMQHPCYST